MKLKIGKATPASLAVTGFSLPMIIIPYARGTQPGDFSCYFYDIQSGGQWINSTINPGTEEMLPLDKIEPALKIKAITEMFSAKALFR